MFKIRTSKFRHVFCDQPKPEVCRWLVSSCLRIRRKVVAKNLTEKSAVKKTEGLDKSQATFSLLKRCFPHFHQQAANQWTSAASSDTNIRTCDSSEVDLAGPLISLFFLIRLSAGFSVFVYFLLRIFLLGCSIGSLRLFFFLVCFIASW